MVPKLSWAKWVLLLSYSLLAWATTDSLTDRVTWDSDALSVDGHQVFLWSGEFHYWRLPVPELYLDVFQKIKASGFNTISVYFHWGYHSAAPNVTDFSSGAHDIQPVFDAAKQAGLWVIARPGPYINAETTGGGFPGYLSNSSEQTRSSEYENYWRSYLSTVSSIIAKNQITNDGTVILTQVENEYTQDMPHEANSTQTVYMEQIERVMRECGIVVPLTYNDPGEHFSWSSDYEDVGGAVDIYGLDSYPAGFDCAHPTEGFNLVTNYRSYLGMVSPSQPEFTPEFQGGSFDPWGGPGYSKCSELINTNFTNVYYRNNIAQGFVMQNLYMIFGGTSWGQLPAPVVYTSYDYGSPIDESRILRDSMREIKLLALFAGASPDLLGANLEANQTGLATDDSIFTTVLQGPSDARFYIVRHNVSNDTSYTSFKLDVTIDNEKHRIPRYVDSTSLSGRQSKIFVTDYPFGRVHSKVLYSTAEIMTFVEIDGRTVLLAYTDEGSAAEICVTSDDDSPTVWGDLDHQHQEDNKWTFSYYQGSGKTVIRLEDVDIWLISRAEAYYTWVPTIDNGYIPRPNNTQLGLVSGPYLLRNATVDGSTAWLTGDTSCTTHAEFALPECVEKVYWNGQCLDTERSPYDTLQAVLPGPDKPAVSMDLADEWRVADSLPERDPSYDDSNWVDADHQSTNNPIKPGSLPVLYADDYGFHEGSILYRARFNGHASAVDLHVQGATAFGFSTWLNGEFLYSWDGSRYNSSANVTIPFSDHGLNDGENVLLVLQDQNGHEESPNINFPRGILYTHLHGCEFTSWKIQGKAGGQANIDPIRGPLNEGGLYGERVGWALPGFDDSEWDTGSLTEGTDNAGVRFYRKSLQLNVNTSYDQSLAFQFPEPSNYTNARVQLYVNGYMYGKYNPSIGPQSLYPVPPGILNYNGNNTVALTVWAQDEDGAALPSLRLESQTNLRSGYNFGYDASYLQPCYSSCRSQYS